MPVNNVPQFLPLRQSDPAGKVPERPFFGGKGVHLCVMHRLEAVLHRPEKHIRLVQRSRLHLPQQCCLPQRFERLQGIPRAYRAVASAVDQLQCLHGEFNVTYSPCHQFDVRRISDGRFDTTFDPGNRFRRMFHERSRVHEWVESGKETASKLLRSCHGARFQQHLPFPQFAARLIVHHVALQ